MKKILLILANLASLVLTNMYEFAIDASKEICLGNYYPQDAHLIYKYNVNILALFNSRKTSIDKN